MSIIRIRIKALYNEILRYWNIKEDEILMELENKRQTMIKRAEEMINSVYKYDYEFDITIINRHFDIIKEFRRL